MFVKFNSPRPHSQSRAVFINPAKVIKLYADPINGGTFIEHEGGSEYVSDSLTSVLKALSDAMDPLAKSMREQAAEMAKLTRPAASDEAKA
jgi:hypothetical protein